MARHYDLRPPPPVAPVNALPSVFCARHAAACLVGGAASDFHPPRSIDEDPANRATQSLTINEPAHGRPVCAVPPDQSPRAYTHSSTQRRRSCNSRKGRSVAVVIVYWILSRDSSTRHYPALCLPPIRRVPPNRLAGDCKLESQRRNSANANS